MDLTAKNGTLTQPRPCGCLWFILPAETHAEVQWSVLPPESMLKSMIYAATDWLTVKAKKASFVVVLTTAGSQLRMRYIEGFCDNCLPTASLQKENV